MELSGFEPVFFTCEQHDDVVLATFLNSHLSDEDNIEQLGRELFALVDQFGCLKVIVDMHAVMYVTSSVLGKLITMHRKLHREEGTFALCQVSKTVYDVLDTSRLVQYFNLFETKEEALGKLA